MKIAIARTKTGPNSDYVISCWEKGLKLNGDTFVTINSENDVQKIEGVDGVFNIAHPYLPGTGFSFCEEEWTQKDLAPVRDNTNSFRVSVYKTAKKFQKRMLFLDTGLFNFNRTRGVAVDNYHQISYDSIKGMGNFYNDNSPPDRWNKLGIKLNNWELDGKHFLIIGQVRFGIGSMHMDIDKFYVEVLSYLKSKTPKECEIRFKPHPNVKSNPTDKSAPNFQKKWKQGVRPKVTLANHKPLSLRDFKAIKCCITFSSHGGIDALIHGCPTIAMSKASMIYKWCNRPLSTVMDSVIVENREQIMSDLAYTQWHTSEIMDGTAWGHLKQFFNVPVLPK